MSTSFHKEQSWKNNNNIITTNSSQSTVVVIECINYSHYQDQKEQFNNKIFNSSKVQPVQIDQNHNDNDDNELQYLASTRNTINTRDLIPPKHW